MLFFEPDVLILALRAIPEKHPDLRLPKWELGIANVFTIEAAGEGDCFLTYFSREWISYLYLVDNFMLDH